MGDGKRSLPISFKFPGGAEISTEDLISGLAIARAAIGNHFETTANGLIDEPVDYPEWRGLYEKVNDAYMALAYAFYDYDKELYYISGRRFTGKVTDKVTGITE